MPSNARVKQVLQFCNVKRQRRVQYKGNSGVLMIVRDSMWTSTVEKGLALSQVVHGTTDYTVETIEEIPGWILEALERKYGTRGFTYGDSASGWSGRSGNFKLLFVPDDEDKEYLVFDTSLTMEEARGMQDKLEENA